MPESAPKVSIVIATYQPGDAIMRVIDSLDAQTMPQAEFEVIFVDDGSPDDTVARLQRIAATRPNYQVHRIENSGWPCKPRNLGIENARGEYLLFMDHDDSLFPRGLATSYAYALQNDADILSPKESKTNDVWWGMSSLTAGNVPNTLVEERIHRLMPFVPHKLYRRSVVMEHDIRFPEGARVLWEDWYINLDVYRHAKVVSILADEPLYLWHASDTNSSHTFNPAREDFWDRLDDMMAHIDSTLDGPEYRADRDVMLAHNVTTRVVDRCVRLLSNDKVADPRAKGRGIKRSKQLLERYASEGVLAHVPRKHRTQIKLILAGRADLVKSFHQADLALTASMQMDELEWRDGVLAFTATARWRPKDPEVQGFRLEGGRFLRIVDRDLAKIVGPELLDYTDDVSSVQVDACVRSRFDYVTWALPMTVTSAVAEVGEDGGLGVTARTSGTVDPGTARLGAPLADTVWDVRMDTKWVGMERKGAIGYAGATLPALVGGRAAVAYANKGKGLTVDLAQHLRTFASDAKPAAGPVGRGVSFSTKLTSTAVFGSAQVDANLAAVADDDLPEDLAPEQLQPTLERLARASGFSAHVVTEGPDAFLRGKVGLGSGRYTVYARREGKLHKTRITFSVSKLRQITFD